MVEFLMKVAVLEWDGNDWTGWSLQRAPVESAEKMKPSTIIINSSSVTYALQFNSMMQHLADISIEWRGKADVLDRWGKADVLDRWGKAYILG